MGSPIPQCSRFVSRGTQSRNFGCANNTYIVCHATVVCNCVSCSNVRNRLTHALRTQKKSSLGDRPIYDFHYIIHFLRHRLHCVRPKPPTIA